MLSNVTHLNVSMHVDSSSAVYICRGERESLASTCLTVGLSIGLFAHLKVSAMYLVPLISKDNKFPFDK